MVERYSKGDIYWAVEYGRPDIDTSAIGEFVLYSDYAALEARCRELEAELKMWQEVKHSSHWKAYAQKLREALENIRDAANSFRDEEGYEVAGQVRIRVDAALSITPTSALASLKKTPCMSCDGTGVDLYDGTNHDCQVCAGTGIIRPSALAAVRDEVLEEAAKIAEQWECSNCNGHFHPDDNCSCDRPSWNGPLVAYQIAAAIRARKETGE